MKLDLLEVLKKNIPVYARVRGTGGRTRDWREGRDKGGTGRGERRDEQMEVSLGALVDSMI